MALPVRCACALALASLLLPLRLRGVSGGEWPPQALPVPRGASWLGNFGKYVKKLFNASLKPKNKKSKDGKAPKKAENATQVPPPNAMKRPPEDATKLLPPTFSQGPSSPKLEKGP